jgi:hypothetical protein
VDEISSSYIEPQNSTIRMSMRRFTRLTNAFSKKFENHCQLALYFCWYNWVRKHKAHKLTPAMAAGNEPTCRNDRRAGSQALEREAASNARSSRMKLKLQGGWQCIG